MDMMKMHIWYEDNSSTEKEIACLDDIYEAIKERLISDLRVSTDELMEYAELKDIS